MLSVFMEALVWGCQPLSVMLTGLCPLAEPRFPHQCPASLQPTLHDSVVKVHSSFPSHPPQSLLGPCCTQISTRWRKIEQGMVDVCTTFLTLRPPCTLRTPWTWEPGSWLESPCSANSTLEWAVQSSLPYSQC